MAKPASGRSLAETVRSNLREVRHGFAPWCDRLPDDLLPEVAKFHSDWVAGHYGRHARPVALLVSGWLAEHGIQVGEQGVTAWLRKRDWKPR